MATPKSRLTFQNLFVDPVSGLFRSATGYLIPASAEQAVVNEMTSFVNKVDDLALYPVVTTSDIVLDFDATALAWTRRFYGLSSFAGSKIVTTGNDTYALHYEFNFEVTNIAAELTFPDHVMNDVQWEQALAGNKIWTPAEIGKYLAVADWDNTAWKLVIHGPFK